MDLFALAEQAKAQGQGFSAKPLAQPGRCEFEHWDDTPVLDFVDRLPDEIIDPASGRSVTISQSLIKSFRKMAMDELCPKRLYHVTVIGDADEEESEVGPMALGKRFEYELTGALDRAGSVPPEILTASGKVGTDQARVSRNAELGKETLSRLGVPHSADPQRNLSFKCLKGTTDLYYPINGGVAIDDIKYSGLLGKTGKWSDMGWYEPDVGQKFHHTCQAAHYTLLAIMNGADSVRFRFVVFDNRAGKEGDHRVFEFRLSEKTMNEHKNLLLFVIDEIQRRFTEDGFRAVPSYEKCSGCPLASSCEDYQAWPEIMVVNA